MLIWEGMRISELVAYSCATCTLWYIIVFDLIVSYRVMWCHVMTCYVLQLVFTVTLPPLLYSFLCLLLLSTCVLKTLVLCGSLYPYAMLYHAMLHCSMSSGLHLSSLPLCTAFTSFVLSLASLSHVKFLLIFSHLPSSHLMLCVIVSCGVLYRAVLCFTSLHLHLLYTTRQKPLVW